MSYRQIHSKIWRDAWFIDLSPDEKLLFIYLFSNSAVSVSGLYELPLRVISFETGLSREQVTSALDKFAEAGKVYYDYEAAVVWVVNLYRYNASRSEKLRSRIKADIDAVPDCEVKRRFLRAMAGKKADNSEDPRPESASASEASAGGKVADTVRIPYRYPIDTLPIGHPPPAAEQEHEQEHEQEQEQEQQQRAPARAGPAAAAAAAVGTGRPSPEVDAGAVFAAWEGDFGPLTPMLAESISDALDEHGAQWVLAAMREAVQAGKRNWHYVQAILDRWRVDGYGSDPPWRRNGKTKAQADEPRVSPGEKVGLEDLQGWYPEEL